MKPVSRMGPPPRSFAADAHDCIMVRSLRTYRIQGCGAMIRARWQSSPLIIVPTTTSVCRRARRGLETTERAARAERRPTLTGPVRVGLNTCVGRGEETGFQVEQRNCDEGSGECREIVLDCKSLIQGLLGVHSRYGLHTRAATVYLTSIAAPVASGWSGRRVGLAPTGKRRLATAHANCGHSLRRPYRTRSPFSLGAKSTPVAAHEETCDR